MISFLDPIQCFPFHLIFAQGRPYMPPVPVASPGTSDNEDFFKERGAVQNRHSWHSTNCLVLFCFVFLVTGKVICFFLLVCSFGMVLMLEAIFDSVYV